MILTPKKLFLIDGAGALTSAFFLGIILVHFNSLFGMPVPVLYILALLACVFAVYSLSCFFLLKRNWRTFLLPIAIINALYCCLTLALVIYFFSQLTTLGILYFVGEILIIIGLVSVEFSAYRKAT